MSKSGKSSISSSVIIGMFIASALLTIFVGNDDEKKGNGNSDSIYVTESQNYQTNESRRPKSQPVSVSEAMEGDPYEELNSLIGLESVKEEVHSLANLVKIQKRREAKGMKNTSMSYHCVFTGSPGTGKTTVARILARIYKDLGVVKSGHLVETDRSGLIAEYVGQTGVKTNAICDSALNGVLFIDEAYALLDNGIGGYGEEAVATLLKRMEDDRDKLVVIVAGYTNEMQKFIDSNPGLQSRFTNYINFPDYTSEELFQIFMMRAKKYSYTLDADGEKLLRYCFDQTIAHKTRNFGNGRYVRNLFEKCVSNQANRLSKVDDPTEEQLSLITMDDIVQAYKAVKK